MKRPEGADRENKTYGADSHGEQIAVHPAKLLLVQGRRQAGDGEHRIIPARAAFPHRMTICPGVNAGYRVVVG
jgi:hypothetical protein